MKTKIEKLAHNKINSTELAKVFFVLCFLLCVLFGQRRQLNNQYIAASTVLPMGFVEPLV
jgi:hypothetical protein